MCAAQDCRPSESRGERLAHGAAGLLGSVLLADLLAWGSGPHVSLRTRGRPTYVRGLFVSSNAVIRCREMSTVAYRRAWMEGFVRGKPSRVRRWRRPSSMAWCRCARRGGRWLPWRRAGRSCFPCPESPPCPVIRRRAACAPGARGAQSVAAPAGPPCRQEDVQDDERSLALSGTCPGRVPRPVRRPR
jgi:hypothetical protein